MIPLKLIGLHTEGNRLSQTSIQNIRNCSSEELKILRMAVSVTIFVHYYKGLVAMFGQRLISEQLKPSP